MIDEPDDDAQGCGCDLDFREAVTGDADISGVVLFAGVPESQIEAHRAELLELFGGQP